MQENVEGRKKMIDLDEPRLKEHLRRRKPEGRYEVSEIEIVLNIRTLQAQANTARVHLLCELLLERCAAQFHLRTLALRHQPHLLQEATPNFNHHSPRDP